MASLASLCIFLLVIMLSSILSSANTAVKGSVEASRRQGQSSLPGVTFPPQLARRASPLNASAIAQFASDLEAGLPDTEIASFCRQAGMICEEQIVVNSGQLFALGGYSVDAISKNLDLNLFFGETKLVPGNWVPLAKEENPVPERAFLPRRLAEKLPFTRVGLPELLRTFNFSTQSQLARDMAETLEICEEQPREGELKACVTSMEAMTDFLVMVLGSGREIKAMMSSSEKLVTKERQMARVINVTEIVRSGGERGSVGCHNAMFPYEVFYCHNLRGTKVLLVHVATQGGEARGFVSCHQQPKSLDSSSSHLLAQFLHVNPQELVCHWNSGDNLVWIPSPS